MKLTTKSHEKKYIIISNNDEGLRVGARNNVLKEFVEKYLTKYYKLNRELGLSLPYLTGFIEINLESKTYQVLPELSTDKGPYFVVNYPIDTSRIIDYIEGGRSIRSKILKELNNKLENHYFEFLDGSPCFQFAVRAYADFQSKWIDTLLLKGTDKLVAVKDRERDKWIGCIIFRIEANGCYNSVHIIKSYVDEEYRNQGVWKNQLWPTLVNWCQDNGIKDVLSRVSTNNEIMKSALNSVGREIYSHNTIYPIPTKSLK